MNASVTPDSSTGFEPGEADDIAATHTTLRNAGIDLGVARAAERMTPHGLLRRRIGVRADGRRALGGAAPALIEWGAAHPTFHQRPAEMGKRHDADVTSSDP